MILVTWLQVGKYLASQADDKSLRVWKTADWTQEAVITEPFEECGGTTHVLRLSWSPDGQYVLSAHAMNGGGPTAQVVERDGWRCDKDFVGHRKAVTCARFNNNIFVKEGKKCCCAAVGSRDRALSIWLTSLKRPLVVIHDLFTDSVLDMSWSSDGLNLLACSSDGSVACIEFTNKEIGTPLTLEEKNIFYGKIYGKCLLNESGDMSSNLLVECPEILLAREKQEAKKETVKEDIIPKNDKLESKVLLSPSQVSNSASSAPLRPMDRQIETRTSDGKRRITPVFIPLTQADANESIGSQPSGTENCFSTSSQSKSRIRVEVRDDIVIHPNVSNHATSLQNTSRTSDNGLDQRLKPRGSIAPLPGLRADELCTRPGEPTQPAAAPATAASLGPVLPTPALGTAGPVVRAAGQYRLQVLNKACNTQYGMLSRLQLLPNNSASSDLVWETYLGSPVTCIACDARFVCVSCADGTIHVWRLARAHATRALPPIALMSQAAKLTLSVDTLAVVTTAAELAMYDLANAKCVIRPLCFRSLLTQGVTVTNCSLMEDGNPMISLNNGKSYIYSKQLCAWLVWADATDPVWRCGGGASRTPHAAHARHHRHKMLRTRPAGFNTNNYSAGAARSWLEAQVASCLHLRLANDYKHWLMTLFEHLVHHGTENQLRSILDDMLGPSHCTSTPMKWQSTIMDMKKHDLLEDMLALLVKQLRWQRIYAEYWDQLAQIKSTAQLFNGH